MFLFQKREKIINKCHKCSMTNKHFTKIFENINHTKRIGSVGQEGGCNTKYRGQKKTSLRVWHLSKELKEVKE